MLDFNKPIYLISDTHFNHANIAKYVDRPKDWQELILLNWFDTVKDSDQILHLGDLALGKKDQVLEIMPFISGKKFLLKGNHDKWNNQFYYDLGFSVMEGEFIWENILFSHRPREIKNGIKFNIHGHIHDIKPEKNHFNVSVEQIGYKPILLSKIMEKLK